MTRARVRRIHLKGRPLSTKVRKDPALTPTHEGFLRLHEIRVPELGRSTPIAYLLDPTQPMNEVIPPLHDAQVPWIKDREMRISGFEKIDGSLVYQCWEVTLVGE